MKKTFLFIIGLWMVASSCEYNSLKTMCYHGKFIMSSCCTGSSFIQLNSKFPIGKTLKYDDHEYTNVIQVPGYLNAGDVYLNLRPFNQEKDSGLFPIHCYCFIAVGVDVPMFVATSFSYSGCPEASTN
jgi:hypothetical protein